MFFREKKSGPRTYLQIVENRWEDGRSKQQVLATLGRLDELQAQGKIDGLLRSGARFAEALVVLENHRNDRTTVQPARRIGPALVFERLWQITDCRDVLKSLLKERRFEFDVERAIFMTVLHRLFDPGSDRKADRWRQDYAIDGIEGLNLHHLYRAMAWLGEALPKNQQEYCTPFAPRCTKDRVEEALFLRRRDLFTSLDIVFFDTTSLYFEGNGGQTIGQRGFSKDHRPDLKQMVVGAVLDSEGTPVCCELWPGNTTDVRTLVPIVERLKGRFLIGNICIVADRGMIAKEVLTEIEARGWLYILGARLRNSVEVKNEVLSRAGRYRVVQPARVKAKDPSPLKVKEVVVEGRRYVVCLNEAQAKKDAADRQAIVDALAEQLKKGAKSLVGNKGYRRYIKGKSEVFEIDFAKIEAEARFDGKWVLQTNTDLQTDEVALKYKQLWMVEAMFRSMKSLLETRPIYHRLDETIRGHVFCSFLALVVRKELEDRLAARGEKLEWADVLRDLEALTEVEVEQNGKRYALRSEARGTCGRVFRAVGVAFPPTVRRLAKRME
jgi:transposase